MTKQQGWCAVRGQEPISLTIQMHHTHHPPRCSRQPWQLNCINATWLRCKWPPNQPCKSLKGWIRWVASAQAPLTVRGPQSKIQEERQSLQRKERWQSKKQSWIWRCRMPRRWGLLRRITLSKWSRSCLTTAPLNSVLQCSANPSNVMPKAASASYKCCQSETAI